MEGLLSTRPTPSTFFWYFFVVVDNITIVGVLNATPSLHLVFEMTCQYNVVVMNYECNDATRFINEWIFLTGTCYYPSMSIPNIQNKNLPSVISHHQSGNMFLQI